MFQREDIATAVATQRGMASGANEVLHVGRLEHGLLRFHPNLGAAITGRLQPAG